MATLTIRNVDETVKRKLKIRAALNGRSMEAEVRSILDSIQDAVRNHDDLGSAIRRRFAPYGGVELDIPAREISNRPLPTFD